MPDDPSYEHRRTPEHGASPSDSELSALALSRPGWLARLLTHYCERTDMAALGGRVERLRREHPSNEPRELVAFLIRARLEGLHVSSHEDCDHGDEASLERGVAESLMRGWDLLQEIGALFGNTGDSLERRFELLTVLALGAQQFKLARKLHLEHLSARAAGDADPRSNALSKLERSFSKLAGKVEGYLAPRGRLPLGPQAQRVGLGLAFVEARTLAQIAATYYERASIEEEGVAALCALSIREKVELVELLVGLAWSDGEVSPNERRMIEQQVALSGISVVEGRRLLSYLDSAPPTLSVGPMEPQRRRFVLEQAVLLSLVDDVQNPCERELLRSIAAALGCEPGELDEVMLGVMAFYSEHRDLLHAFGAVSSRHLNTLRSSLSARASEAVSLNLGRLLQEIRETGELARLLTAASVRELSAEEAAKVKEQLLDVCRTIPALAIFLLPGGALLLPILVQALPFSVLPSAFKGEGEPGL